MSTEENYNPFQLSDTEISHNFFNNLEEPSTAAGQLDFPFVRIHAFFDEVTSPTVPAVNSNFRSNRHEIKAEPIKSELNETGGQSTPNNNRSTPNSRNANTPEQQQQQTEKAQTKLDDNSIKILKCPNCVFLTLSESNLKNHLTAETCNNSRQKFNCPGCDYIFYSTLSLEAHLQHDHFLAPDEIKKYLNQNKAKSRISIKNVDCLREPQPPDTTTIHENLENHDSALRTRENLDFSLNFCDSSLNFIDLINDDNQITNLLELQSPLHVQSQSQLHVHPQPQLQLSAAPTQQKISIKSVETLCEQQNTNFNDYFVNDAGPQQNKPIANKVFYDMDNGYMEGFSDIQSSAEPILQQPRRVPKIYIKNVDILKEPIFLPPSKVTSILNVNETMHFSNFPATQPIPIPMNNNDLMNPLNNDYNDFITNENNGNFHNFPSYNSSGCSKNSSHILEKPKSKIYIKNVDILKAPQQLVDFDFNKNKTNFIHLRTVDEINEIDLMNKNEMQNLFNANFADQQNLTPTPPANNYLNPSNENSKNSTEELLARNNFEFDFQNQNSAIQVNQYNFDNIENRIDSNSSSKIRYYDLNTPQAPAIEECERRDDNEIFFVCAEELINSNSSNNFEKMDETFSINLDSNLGGGNLQNHSLNTILESNTVCREINSEQKSEKGRIYVSDNLMENRSKFDDTANKLTPDIVQKKTKGRPFGSKSLKINKPGLQTNSLEKPSFKCDWVKGCGFKFQKNETLEYHKKCHSGESLENVKCPECKSTEFSSWNNLHTHLWRQHQIDMELYSCDLCNFKTPILSRLINTHNKIHSDERNYKCDYEQCEKSFKNSKQLKNHRRIHRQSILELHKCDECGAVFSTMRTRKEHICQQLSDTLPQELKCSICNKSFSSKNSLKLHLLKHETTFRFNCDNCDYKSNDHNSFRRHKTTHDKSNSCYQCSYCDYKCIQSVLYKKHLMQKHPDLASNIILKCPFCAFSTINKTQYHVHLAKHGTVLNNGDIQVSEVESDIEFISLQSLETPPSLGTEIEPENGTKQQNKIKVKSNLVLKSYNAGDFSLSR